jgi:DNA-binding NarL/FixJ family response regulator
MAVRLADDEKARRGDRARGVAVLIADPHPATRGALRTALDYAETVRVVGEASDLPSAIRAVSADQADIALADSRIAGLGSESARAGLAQLSRQAPVIVMGMTDPRFYTAPLQAAGAAGYWPKDGDLAQLTGLLGAAASTDTPAPQSAPPNACSNRANDRRRQRSAVRPH